MSIVSGDVHVEEDGRDERPTQLIQGDIFAREQHLQCRPDLVFCTQVVPPAQAVFPIGVALFFGHDLGPETKRRH